MRLWADVDWLLSSDPPSSWNISVFVHFRRPEETTERNVACFTFLSTWSVIQGYTPCSRLFPYGKRRELSTVKFANFLLELLTQADTITSNKTFEHWRQRDPACREFARAMKTKGKKNTARIWELDLVGQETRAPSIDSESQCGAPRSRWFFIGIGSIVTKAGEARLAVKWLAFRAMSRKSSMAQRDEKNLAVLWEMELKSNVSSWTDPSTCVWPVKG